jgi:hypothetical protein
MKAMNWRSWCLGWSLVLVTGCGYLKSGTWEDDPANWERAFRSAKPEDVAVVHSRCWRSPHWSGLTRPAAGGQATITGMSRAAQTREGGATIQQLV